MADDTIEKLLLLLLGWLLGLLAPAVVDTIKRGRENALGHAAIRHELLDVAHKILLAAQYIYIRKGSVDRSHLEWVKRHLEGYVGIEDDSSIMQSICLQLSWTDDQLKDYAVTTRAAPGIGIILQKYPVALLDSRVAALWSFRTDIQRRLLQIRTDIELLNDIVDRSRYYSDLTFTQIGQNFDLIRENVLSCYDQYFARAKKIVDQIHDIKFRLQ